MFKSSLRKFLILIPIFLLIILIIPNSTIYINSVSADDENSYIFYPNHDTMIAENHPDNEPKGYLDSMRIEGWMVINLFH